MNMNERPRRLRKNASVRGAVRETILRPEHLVWPAFIREGSGKREDIKSLPGCQRLSVDMLLQECERLHGMGLGSVALFPAIDDSLKDSKAKEAVNPEGLVPRAIEKLKKAMPELTVITDVALDPYSSDGHDGIVRDGMILNDESVVVLSEQARVHAAAGADFVAPSDMMDGRVGWIRAALDESGFSNTGIISYTAKYASAFYGPFREALDSAPKFGDKKTYQMDPANSREALREARLDTKEGADMLLVKPALAYLDIITRIEQKSDLPVAAYNVSGEYAMVKAAAANKWLEERLVVMEILTSIRRAGASLIFSYHTPDVLKWLKDSK
jgi:porphobilinogen synthase